MLRQREATNNQSGKRTSNDHQGLLRHERAGLGYSTQAPAQFLQLAAPACTQTLPCTQAHVNAGYAGAACLDAICLLGGTGCSSK